MVTWVNRRRAGPIGVDIGSRSVKLLQFNADRTAVIESARRELPLRAVEEEDPQKRAEEIAAAIRSARQGRAFRGRDAVVCLGARELFVQNVRVTKTPGAELEKIVRQEAAGRLPYSIAEAEIRFIEAGDVRQGEVTKRELILLSCHRPVLENLVTMIDSAGLRPIAVDVEPAALLRCYVRQYRRDEDKQQRAMYVHVGAANTAVIISCGEEALFVKYVDVGGHQMDEAIARHLEMDLKEAAAIRRHNGDRRSDQQDPEISRSIAEALRPVMDRIAGELSMCSRYHSVTFRGQPLDRVVLCGGEASPPLVEALNQHSGLKCELGDPLRSYQNNVQGNRKAQWDVAAGLALRESN